MNEYGARGTAGPVKSARPSLAWEVCRTRKEAGPSYRRSASWNKGQRVDPDPGSLAHRTGCSTELDMTDGWSKRFRNCMHEMRQTPQSGSMSLFYMGWRCPWRVRGRYSACH